MYARGLGYTPGVVVGAVQVASGAVKSVSSILSNVFGSGTGGVRYASNQPVPNQIPDAVLALAWSRSSEADKRELARLWNVGDPNPLPVGNWFAIARAAAGGNDGKVTTAEGRAFSAFVYNFVAKYAGATQYAPDFGGGQGFIRQAADAVKDVIVDRAAADPRVQQYATGIVRERAAQATATAGPVLFAIGGAALVFALLKGRR